MTFADGIINWLESGGVERRESGGVAHYDGLAGEGLRVTAALDVRGEKAGEVIIWLVEVPFDERARRRVVGRMLSLNHALLAGDGALRLSADGGHVVVALLRPESAVEEGRLERRIGALLDLARTLRRELETVGAGTGTKQEAAPGWSRVA